MMETRLKCCQVNKQYTKKRGAGVHVFSYDPNSTAETPYSTLLVHFLSSMGDSTYSTTAALIKMVQTLSRILNDRVSILWRNGPDTSNLPSLVHLKHETDETILKFSGALKVAVQRQQRNLSEILRFQLCGILPRIKSRILCCILANLDKAITESCKQQFQSLEVNEKAHSPFKQLGLKMNFEKKSVLVTAEDKTPMAAFIQNTYCAIQPFGGVDAVRGALSTLLNLIVSRFLNSLMERKFISKEVAASCVGQLLRLQEWIVRYESQITQLDGNEGRQERLIRNSAPWDRANAVMNVLLARDSLPSAGKTALSIERVPTVRRFDNGSLESIPEAIGTDVHNQGQRRNTTLSYSVFQSLGFPSFSRKKESRVYPSTGPNTISSGSEIANNRVSPGAYEILNPSSSQRCGLHKSERNKSDSTADCNNVQQQQPPQQQELDENVSNKNITKFVMSHEEKAVWISLREAAAAGTRKRIGVLARIFVSRAKHRIDISAGESVHQIPDLIYFRTDL